ncbi:glycoside hydrolase family 25 protein [Oricola cellulosilytica]|nr:glycoside hydrolase family 25 protein [Oricola cellulosilytica]
MSILAKFSALAVVFVANVSGASASEFFRPWGSPELALILDGYEHNVIDFHEIVEDKRVTAFIHKGSDGMPPKYRCRGTDNERALCRQTWQRYAISKELYRTRRTLAKKLGLKWGAYHLARAGNPLAQARHFLDFADPQDDELIALDIEGLNSEKWMSLDDAEKFATYIRARTGRYPILYANEVVSRRIAERRTTLPILSRLPLWYARYKPTIRGAFPKGNWESYAFWQFAYQGNCSARRCPYRVPGTNRDIDVNVANLSPDALRSSWPLGHLVEEQLPLTFPLPIARPEPPNLPDFAPPASMIADAETTLSPHRHRIAGYLQYAHARLGITLTASAQQYQLPVNARETNASPVNDLY